MYPLLYWLGNLAGLVSLVCFILVVIKMFQNGQTVLGVVCIVTFFCLIGMIIALVVGWQNEERWRIRNLMLVYTISFAVSIVLSGAAYAMAPNLVLVRVPA